MSVGYRYLKIFQLVYAFREAIMKTGFKKAVIGLSGGVDSALAAVLISQSIGAENLLPVFMPYKTSEPSSMIDAVALAEKFSLHLETIDITEVADTFFNGKGDISDLRRGNAMSRIRMATLFDIAQKENAIVAGTSNKTEITLGYGTWYGDMASSINILGSLYKREVYEFAEYLELPKSIIEKKPTADLWVGQTDEEELGFSYDIADKFLYAAFELQLDKEHLAEIFGCELTNKILDKIRKNAFKRSVPVICGAGGVEFFEKMDCILGITHKSD